ncbi:sorting nexin-11 isoform X2 [Nematostella vectensis]|uniref:sorting nexin-11 isoform X2 n=1 Tax=Nematostella vectensis TaxID=45351 RepID=UPI0013906414|nr:sorting nexin-11 isoform X2 [Nematostella vectensis]
MVFDFFNCRRGHGRPIEQSMEDSASFVCQACGQTRIETRSRSYQAILVEVNRPQIHICKGSKFVDYEIYIQTNNMAFAKKLSNIRRRYSDFIWLRKQLTTNEVNGFGSERVVPCLPPKRLFGRFEPKFVFSRKHGLQDFLDKVLSIRDFLSYSGLHLFLQSKLSVDQIEAYLDGRYKQDLMVDEIISQELSEDPIPGAKECSAATCPFIVISDSESFTFVDCIKEEDVQSFHSSVMASGDSCVSINSMGQLDPQETRTFLYTSYK